PCDFLAVSPREDLLAFRDAHGRLALWDPAIRAISHHLTSPAGEEVGPAFPEDAARLAGLTDRNTIVCWDVATERVGETSPGPRSLVYTVAGVPHEQLLVSGDYDGNVRLWTSEPAERDRLQPAHAQGVITLVFSPDGARLVSGSRDGAIRQWQ